MTTATAPSTRGKPAATGQRRRRFKSGTWTLFFLVLPSIVLLLLIHGFPLVSAFIQSLHNGTLIDQGPFVGFQNYVDNLTSSTFWKAAGFTVVFTVVGVFGSWAVGLALALLLRTRIPAGGIFKVLLLLPWVVPIVVSSTAINWLVATSSSPIPMLFENLGLAPPLFLADPTWAKILVCVFKVWISFPFMMMMTSAALASVDETVYEAARMDGATSSTAAALDHPADDRPVHLHLVDPHDDLLRQRLPDHLPGHRRRPHRRHQHPGRDGLPDGVPEPAGRPRSVNRVHDDRGPGVHLHPALPADPKGSDLMAIIHQTAEIGHVAEEHQQQLTTREKGTRGQWWRFVLILLITIVALVPVAVVLFLAFTPSVNSTTSGGFTLENFSSVFANTDVVLWLQNSLLVTLGTVIVSVIVAAPAGYVLSRGRSRAVSGYSLLLFVFQSLPVITSVIPLFILFANLGLVDNLGGLMIVYVASAMAVATWMMAAYMDSIPISLEEAAWIDGASLFRGFVQVVLRNSLPGVLSTAIFTFLVAWNDYLVAIVFLRSATAFTLPLGVQSFFQQNTTDWGGVMAVAVVMMIPPVLIFVLLNKYFSVGGIGGSLAGQ